MKVLMASDFYPPFIGGSFKYVQRLSKCLVRKGHEIVVCTIGNEYLKKYEDDEGVKVIRFEGFFQRIPFIFEIAKKRNPPPISDFLINEKLEKIIAEFKPDVIHCHGWLLYSALRLKRNNRIPIVVTLHDYSYLCPSIDFLNNGRVCDKPLTIKCIKCVNDKYGFAKSFFTYFSMRFSQNELKNVNKFIAVSSFVKEVYSKQLNLNNGKIVVVPNFYEKRNEKFQPKCVEGFNDEFILFVGSLSRHKGVDILIDAFNRLDSKTRLVLIGGRYPAFRYKSSGRITVIEDASDSVIQEAYANCKFTIIPSIFPDPSPSVAFEAMSYKKAIIASCIGGLNEIIVNCKTGIHVAPGDPAELSSALSWLIDNPLMQIQMGKEGFQRFLKNYTADVVVTKIEKIYRDLISEK